MARPPDPERREEVLEDVASYLLEHGLDLTLRPLAKAVGTSPRMLLYHFGSKDRLIADALARVREREQQFMLQSIAAGTDPLEVFLAMWRWMTSARAEPFLRLFFQVYASSLSAPERFDGFAKRAVSDWLPVFEEALRGAGVSVKNARGWSTLLVSASRGLLLDLLATHERKRVKEAANLLVRVLSEDAERALAGVRP